MAKMKIVRAGQRVEQQRTPQMNVKRDGPPAHTPGIWIRPLDRRPPSTPTPEVSSPMRRRRIEAEVERVREWQALAPDRISIVGPEPLDRVWTTLDVPLQLRLGGLTCATEGARGERGEASEHFVQVRFPADFPFRGSIGLFVDIGRTPDRRVPFHPNIVSLNGLEPNKTPGYICLWHEAPADCTVIRAVLQCVELLTYRSVNEDPPHADLNPRALAAWQTGELAGYRSDALILPPQRKASRSPLPPERQLRVR